MTKEVGSALRFVSVLTNAPFECGDPCTRSKCPPNCKICVDICPGKAVVDKNWDITIDMNSFFDAMACNKAARARAKGTLDIDRVFCGLCASSCPYTETGLGYK